MSDPEQLTLDGSTASVVARVPRQPVGPGGAAILHHLRDHEAISPLEAGVLVHALHIGGRGPCTKPWRYEGPACCQYASTDGLSALTRLMARGMVWRESRGRYVAS